MTVTTKKAAWEVTDTLVPTDYTKNEYKSSRAGYDIYDGINGDYICDLGNRLEINLATGETVNIWIEAGETVREHKSSEELDQIAENIAEHITIRTYDNGSSIDTRRATTAPEKKILYNIARAALGSLNYGEKMRSSDDMTQAAINTAEFMLLYFIPDANSYDSIYLPLQRAIKNWKRS